MLPNPTGTPDHRLFGFCGGSSFLPLLPRDFVAFKVLVFFVVCGLVICIAFGDSSFLLVGSILIVTVTCIRSHNAVSE
jgi:hypothetical protein